MRSVATYRIDSRYYLSQVNIEVKGMSKLEHVKDLIERARKQGSLLDGKVDSLRKIEPRYLTIKLLNPHMEFIAMLDDLLDDTPYRISRLETAYGINTSSKMEALELLRHACNELVIPLIERLPILQRKSSNYFKSFCFGTKSDMCTFVMRVPTGKDAYGETSLQTRLCFKGTDTIRTYGFWVLGDLVSINFAQWYQLHVKSYVVNTSRTGEIYCITHRLPVPSEEECHDIFKSIYGKKLALLHLLYHTKEYYRGAIRDHRLVVYP